GVRSRKRAPHGSKPVLKRVPSDGDDREQEQERQIPEGDETQAESSYHASCSIARRRRSGGAPGVKVPAGPRRSPRHRVRCRSRSARICGRKPPLSGRVCSPKSGPPNRIHPWLARIPAPLRTEWREEGSAE